MGAWIISNRSFKDVSLYTVFMSNWLKDSYQFQTSVTLKGYCWIHHSLLHDHSLLQQQAPVDIIVTNPQVNIN